jgi:hypothetical protein
MTLLTMDICENFVSHNCGYVCCGGKKKSFIVHKSSLLRARVSGCSKLGGACLKSSKLLFGKASKKILPPSKRGLKSLHIPTWTSKTDFHAMELAFVQYIIKLQQPYYIAHSTN